MTSVVDRNDPSSSTVPQMVTEMNRSYVWISSDIMWSITVSWKVKYTNNILFLNQKEQFWPVLQQPVSSRPPVEYYIIRHNTTGDGSVSEVISHWTNITIHGAQPGHVYFIQVTPVNVLGTGPPVTISEILIYNDRMSYNNAFDSFEFQSGFILHSNNSQSVIM